MGCVVPDWVATDRAIEEYRQHPDGPPPIPLDVLTDAVVGLTRDDESAGRVVTLLPLKRDQRGAS
jgi:hypothetical protein